MITKFGKRFLAGQLAGVNSFAGRDLALGIGSTPADANGNDTKLEFEFYRMPVLLSSFDVVQTGVDGNNNPIFEYHIFYSSTIPKDFSGVVS